MSTNAERAAHADRTVTNYSADSSPEECLSDLLGDLRHFCDKYGVDFGERDNVGHRNYLSELAEEKPAEPAYTVVGIYFDGVDLHERYATTVYTRGGSKAAEALAQEACRIDNDHDTSDDLIEISAVIEGEVQVVA
jgi:hypothetical protein